MYAIIQHYQFDRSTDEIRAILQQPAMMMFPAMDGFRGFYFVEDDVDRGMIIMLWATPRDAQAAMSEFGAWVMAYLQPYIVEQPIRVVGPATISIAGMLE